MADDRQACACVMQHDRGNISGVGAFVRKVNVLCTDGEIRSGACCTFDQDRRKAKRDIDAGRRFGAIRNGPDLRDIRRDPVHLPVPNDIFAQRHCFPLFDAVAVSGARRLLEAALEGLQSGT